MSISRLSVRILLFASLAIAVCGLALTPRLLHAQQESAPATEPAPVAAAAAQPVAAKSEESSANSEEEEKNVYRHTKLVAYVGQMLHISTEQAARMFEIINFLILALCIVIPLVRFLPRVFRRRAENLREKIEIARRTTTDANDRLSAVESKLADLDKEIAAFRTEVEGEMARDEERLRTSIEEEKLRIVASAEQEIASASDHAQRTLRTFAAQLAIEQAAKQLVLTPEVDRALIAEFIDNVNGKGGQN